MPSQYLCELIKRAGYDGVVYKSALAGGFNAALFNQNAVNVRGVKRVTVGSVTISIG
ncbi:hypothetical protein [Alkalimonas mucilaginosa]|uniref:hypothetical protein n=1 Tax=Alkalimonas mucilaginosa TaxID=3057676 RepID=UPI0038B411DD